MPRPSAVAFDLDGLMFDTEPIYRRVGTELMRRRGKSFSDDLNHAIMGFPPQACFETMIGWHDLDETWQTLQAESEKLFLDLLGDGAAPMPGLLELLQALESAAVAKAICTSSTRVVLQAVLGPSGVEDRFQFSLTSQDVTHGKPDPEIYLTAAKRFGVQPSEMVVLEDSQTGCRAAVASGAFAIAVPDGPSLEHDFSSASLVVDSLQDPRLYEALGLK